MNVDQPTPVEVSEKMTEEPLVPYDSSHGTQEEVNVDPTQGEYDINEPTQDIIHTNSPNQNPFSPLSKAVHEIVQEIEDQTSQVNPPLVQETNPEVLDSIALTEMLHTPVQPIAPPFTPIEDVQGSTGQFLNPFSQWRDHPKSLSC